MLTIALNDNSNRHHPSSHGTKVVRMINNVSVGWLYRSSQLPVCTVIHCQEQCFHRQGACGNCLSSIAIANHRRRAYLLSSACFAQPLLQGGIRHLFRSSFDPVVNRKRPKTIVGAVGAITYRLNRQKYAKSKGRLQLHTHAK